MLIMPEQADRRPDHRKPECNRAFLDDPQCAIFVTGTLILRLTGRRGVLQDRS